MKIKIILFSWNFVEIKLFITDEIPVIAVHPNTLGQNQLGTFVYVVNAENKLETRQVEIQYSNEDIAIIKSGLNEGDDVVVSDITKLGNGMLS